MSSLKQPDPRFINVDDLSEMDYWAKYFDTSRDELLAAVSEVGASAQRVRELLARKNGDG
jgi:hypothetical protein